MHLSLKVFIQVRVAPEPVPEPAHDGQTARADNGGAESDDDANSSASSSKYDMKRASTMFGMTAEEKTKMLLDDLATPSVFESQPFWWTPAGCFRRLSESRTRRLASASQVSDSFGSVTVKSVDAIYNVRVKAGLMMRHHHHVFCLRVFLPSLTQFPPFSLLFISETPRCLPSSMH